MSNNPFPIWGFAALGFGLGSVGFMFGILTLEGAFLFAGFIGLPTWFIGLLLFGIKSDELLGVDGAFAYETLPDQSQDSTNNH